MKTRDLVDLAARNLREAVFRNSLTTVGIGVGVASLVAMLSLGVGLQNLASNSLSHSGLFNAIIVTPRTNFTGFGRPARTNPAEAAAAAAPIVPLDESARSQIRALPNVIEVYPEIRFPTEIHYNGNPYPTVVAGIPESDRDGGSFDGMQGHFFSGPDASEAILQIDLAKQLSDQPYSLLGKDLVLRYAERTPLPTTGGANSDGGGGGFSIVPHEEKLRVVGIVETEPSAGLGTFGRGRLLIPLQLAEQLQATQTNDLRDLIRATPASASASAKKTYDNLTVRVKDAVDVKAAEDAIKKMGFSVFSLLDATQSLRLVFGVFDLLLLIFGGLALVVASLGIVNTLVMAIIERRREIGVLKALGAADRVVQGLFFAEAAAMGLLGGVLGVALGWLIARALNFGTDVYLSRQQLPSVAVAAVPWWMVAFAILFSILVSLAAGIYPASRAAKLNPVEALRYE